VISYSRFYIFLQYDMLLILTTTHVNSASVFL